METWNHLGKRTFWLFLYRRIPIPMTFFFLGIIFTMVRAVGLAPESAAPYLGLAGIISLAIFVVGFGLAYLVTYLVYRNYEYALAEDALKIRRGVFTVREVAIPYRQIQDVSIERTIPERIMGVSSVVILTAGHDDPHQPASESDGVLSIMDRDLAESLQSELIRRADVQRVIETK